MNNNFEEIVSAETAICYDMTMDTIHNCIPILIKKMNIEDIWIEKTRIFEINEMASICLPNSTEPYIKVLSNSYKNDTKIPLRAEDYPMMTTIFSLEHENYDNRSFIIVIHFTQCIKTFKRISIDTGILSYDYLAYIVTSLIHELIHVQQLSYITPGFDKDTILKLSDTELDEKLESYAYENMNKLFDEYKDELDYIINSSLNKFINSLDQGTNFWFTKSRIDLNY